MQTMRSIPDEDPRYLAAERLASRHRSRAKALGHSRHFTARQWLELCANYDWGCVCCGEERPLTPDHIIPLSQGGSNAIENIQPLCLACNIIKRDAARDFRGDWHKRDQPQAYEIPALLSDKALRLLEQRDDPNLTLAERRKLYAKAPPIGRDDLIAEIRKLHAMVASNPVLAQMESRRWLQEREEATADQRARESHRRLGPGDRL